MRDTLKTLAILLIGLPLVWIAFRLEGAYQELRKAEAQLELIASVVQLFKQGLPDDAFGR